MILSWRVWRLFAGPGQFCDGGVEAALAWWLLRRSAGDDATGYTALEAAAQGVRPHVQDRDMHTNGIATTAAGSFWSADTGGGVELGQR